MELLAKPDETLTDHTKRVLKIAQEIGKRLRIPETLRERIKLACLMHDVGKATRSFQKRICEAQQLSERPSTAYPHALASFLLTFALERKQFGQSSAPLAAAAVLSHHSPLHPTLYQGLKSPDWIRDALQQWLERWFPSPDIIAQLQPLLDRNPSEWLHQEFNYPDGSRTLMEQLQRLPVQDFSTVKAVLCLADWLTSGGHPSADMLFLNGGAQLLQRHLRRKRFSLYSYQQRVLEVDTPRLYLHAPTGSGKTEALLLWAGETERILYLLPTQATVNAMYKRLQRIYGEAVVGIAHSHALLEIARDIEEPPLDARLFSHVFAKPITIATLDQYLLAHLHGRHWEIRRALCRNATVLMDEIHAYEPYTLGLLQAALESDPPARFAVASATLPSPLRQTLGEASLITAENPLWHQQRHRLCLEDQSPSDALQEALHHAARGETVLFVVNIVPLAQQLYQQAQAIAQQMRVGEINFVAPTVKLLHSRFIYRDRRQKEQTISTPSTGTLLITTQVVEVSLDISYQRLYTELAPLDALVQRMGRVNRKGEQTRPAPVHILCRYDGRSEYLYGANTLQQTLQLLQALPETPTNQDLSEATDQLYRSIWQSDEFQRERQQGYETLKAVQRICGCYTIDLADEQMRQRFATRKGEVQIEVLPQMFQQEAYRLREQKSLWRLPELLVPVPYWWLIRFAERFEVPRDLGVPITSLPYDSEIGLAHPLQEEGQPADVLMEWI
ncbi:CRISPR-associated endonuclease/helicase Cas3 [bacterium HR15]|nr:CRISPR-associated endonuclease/helicase Cas3 [bacterium HR15]